MFTIKNISWIKSLAKELHIDLLYLPLYSPILFLLREPESFVRTNACITQYYDNFTSFKTIISFILEQTQTEYKDKITSFCALKFPIFKIIKNIFP